MALFEKKAFKGLEPKTSLGTKGTLRNSWIKEWLWFSGYQHTGYFMQWKCFGVDCTFIISHWHLSKLALKRFSMKVLKLNGEKSEKLRSVCAKGELGYCRDRNQIGRLKGKLTTESSKGDSKVVIGQWDNLKATSEILCSAEVLLKRDWSFLEKIR